MKDKLLKAKEAFAKAQAETRQRNLQERKAMLIEREAKAKECVEHLIDLTIDDLSLRGVAYIRGWSDSIVNDCFLLGVDVRIADILQEEGIDVVYFPSLHCIRLKFISHDSKCNIL